LSTLTLLDRRPEVEERPAPSLRADGVTAGYGSVPVIRDVSIAVGPSEIVAVIGPNGAGKSTLLKALVGILRVTGGKVLLGSDDVTNRAPEELARRGVGYVPQVNDIFEPLTVLENLEMGGYLLSQSQIRKRVEEVGAVFPQLPPMLKRRADKLSGGERKMLAIGRVLMLDPKVLILDEPTANLSPKLADSLLHEHVKRLAGVGKAVLLVERRCRSRPGRACLCPARRGSRAGRASCCAGRTSRSCFWALAPAGRLPMQVMKRRTKTYEAGDVSNQWRRAARCRAQRRRGGRGRRP
jgi:branched-chain amino acid transport system ATP-binding protein